MPRGNRRSTPTPVPQPVNNDQNNPPTPAAEDAVREAQAIGVGAPAEEQPAAETPAEAEARSGLTMTVQIRGGVAAEDIVATADVTLGDLCTIRNVKLKQDDYGLKVVMPRTKLPETGRFKDACYFHSPELREQFDAAVKDAYQQTLEPAQEQGGMGGMTM